MNVGALRNLQAINLRYVASDITNTSLTLSVNEPSSYVCIIFTARNEVGARQYFQKRVSKNSVHGGGGGGVWGLQANTQGEVEGSGQGRVSRPTSKGEVEGSGLGISRPTPRGVSRPTTRESLQAHTQGGPQACTEADIPQQTATAAGSTHPTGMHSCYYFSINDGDVLRLQSSISG